MFLPPRILSATYDNIEVTEVWTENDGGFYDNNPYKWRLTLTVSVQSHGSQYTREPYSYEALDISVGDWISDISSGLAVQVVSIESADATTATVIVEDIDRFNTFTSSDGSAIGGLGSDAVIYTLSENGFPILGPSPAALVGQNASWAVDQFSRFTFRNLVQSYFRVEQPGHILLVGDVVRIRTEDPERGNYEKVVAGSSVEGIVGVVNSIGVPGVNWFTYRPSGRVVANLNPTLPGQPGDFIYVDNQGAYTITRPNVYAKPIFIRLSSGNIGLQIDRNVDPLPVITNNNTVTTVGYIAQSIVVDNLTARDAITNSNDGDQVKVLNNGNGEWAQYIWHTNSWHLMMTQDASHTDAQTLEYTFTTNGTYTLGTLSSGSRVTLVTIEIEAPFNRESLVTVGTDVDVSALMSSDLSDLSSLGSFSATPAVVFDEAGDTTVKVYVTNVSENGSARVAITYS